MKATSRTVAVLSVVLLLGSSSITSCGVMFGAEEADFCAEQSCSLPSQCPPTSCLCADGSSRVASTCITEKSCCAKTSYACEQLCAPHGGWSGQADAGTAGASGSAGQGGASGIGGSAGSSGFGGASGFAGSSGSAGRGGSAGTGGSAGSSGLPRAGQSCSGATRAVSCGCISATDTTCSQVLRCSSATSTGTWIEATQCDPGDRCLMNTSRSTANCGTTSFYLPYALVGAPCLTGDTFACTIDLASELICSGGRWTVQQTCPGECGILQGGTTRCPSMTGFCVGCL